MRIIKLVIAFLFIFVSNIWAMENEPSKLDGFEIGTEPDYQFFIQVKHVKTDSRLKWYDLRKNENHSFSLFDGKILEGCIWIGDPTDEVFEKEKIKYIALHGKPDTVSMDRERSTMYWKGKINTVILEYSADSIRYSIVNQEIFLDFIKDFLEKAKGGKEL